MQAQIKDTIAIITHINLYGVRHPAHRLIRGEWLEKASRDNK